MNCSEIKIRITGGQRDLFALSEFAFKPLLPCLLVWWSRCSYHPSLLIEFCLALANSLSHSGNSLSDTDMSELQDGWDFPCSEDKQEAQLQAATSARM